MENKNLKGEIPENWFEDDFFKDKNVNEPDPKRDETTYLKYYQIPKTIKIWNPAQSIYWSEERVNKLIEDHPEFINKMETIERPDINFDTMQCRVHFDVIHDNGGEMFYIYFQEKYYFGQVISRNISAGKSKYLLQLDIATFMIPDGNQGNLKGTMALQRGHALIKEHNSIHSDNCSSIQNTKKEHFSPNIDVDDGMQYYFLTNGEISGKGGVGDGNKIYTSRDILIGGKGSELFPTKRFTLTPMGTVFGAGENLFYYTPLLSQTIVDGISLFLDSEVLLRMRLKDLGIDFDNRVWDSSKITHDALVCLIRYWPDNAPVGCPFPDKIPEFQGRAYKGKMFLEALIKSKNLVKWYIIPKIFKGLGNDIIERTEFNVSDVMEYIKFDNNNHLFAHYKISLNLSKLMIVVFNPWFINENKIYVERIVNNDNIKFNFYYDKGYLDLFQETTLSLEQGQRVSKWEEFLRDKSVSYENGWKTQQQLGLANMIGSAGISTASGSLIGGLAGKSIQGGLIGGATGLLGGLVNFGFNAYSSAMQRYYQEQDLKRMPATLTNTPNYDILIRILIRRFVEAKMYQVEERKNDDPNNYENIFNTIWFDKISDGTGYSKIVYTINRPEDKDVEFIKKDQIMRGNVVAGEFETNNPFELKTENDYTYIQGAISPYQTDKINNQNLNLLNNILVNGIVILNKGDEWK